LALKDAQIRLDEIITKIQMPFSQPAYQSDHLSGQDFVSSIGEDKY
jgi:hypothetical protein